MTKTRFRLAALSSTLLGLLLAASCTVNSSGDDDDDPNTRECSPGRSIECACRSGGQGHQVCNSSGTKYGACECDGGAGGSDGGGGAPANDGGQVGAGAAANGGAPAASGGSAGEGGSDSTMGGATGAGGFSSIVCAGAEAETACEGCYYDKCCDQLSACLADDACVEQFIAMRDCSNEVVSAHGAATPADVDHCAPAPAGSQHWPGNHVRAMIDLIDCMNGGVGWESLSTWGEKACKAECYVK